MKSHIDKNDTNTKETNDHITSMRATLIDTSAKTNKQEERITELSSKLSTYEDRMEKIITNKT